MVELKYGLLCSDFLCSLLHQLAHDEKQGDDGKRIEQCKCWMKGRWLAWLQT